MSSNPTEDPSSPPQAPPSPEILADTSTYTAFEGQEKLTEVWFAPSAAELPASSHHIGSGIEFRVGQNLSGKNWEGLRKVPRKVWEDMLDIVKCKILSVVEGEDVDAYLLSESSFFVSPHQVILKTCGTTINLLGLTKIIDIAREYCGFNSVYRCFYSRKSFFFPDRQLGPHRGWREEVDFLDGVFNKEGAAYTVGPMNGDHWLLYLTSPSYTPHHVPSPLSLLTPSLTPTTPTLANLSLTNGNGHHSNAFASSSSPPQTPRSKEPLWVQDSTLEILMTHLSPEGRAPFFHPSSTEAPGSRSGHVLGSHIAEELGIDSIFPKEETTLDSFGFEPCGYSANAIVGSGSREGGEEGGEGGGYFTIHVTPEEGWSFASFECNVPLPHYSASSRNGIEGTTTTTKLTSIGTTSHRPDLQTLIRKVVSIFQPSRLSITLFLSTPPPPSLSSSVSSLQESEEQRAAWTSFSKDLLGAEYIRKDRIGYEFEGYDLVFACFEKPGMRGVRGPDAPAI